MLSLERMDLDRPELRAAIALAIGVLIGAEREQRKGRGPNRAAAGIRTFAVVALLGGLTWYLGQAAVVATGIVVGLFAMVAYVLGSRRDPGLTTEVALLATYAVGAVAQQEPRLAIGCGVVMAALLAYRSRIHGFVTHVLTPRELLDGLAFALAAFVILPLLPDRAVGPLGVLNPFVLWRLVVIVMAVTAAGHIAQRVVGPRFGLAIAGFASGFASSTATLHAMGKRARSEASLLDVAVAGAAASTVSTLVELAVLVGVASPTLLQHLALPLAAGGLVALAYAIFWTWRAARTHCPAEASGRAFSLKTAIVFAALVTTVTFASRLLGNQFGDIGAVGAAAVAGLADTHATSASSASLFARDLLGREAATLAVLVALSANTLVKAAIAFIAGTRAYGLRIVLGLAPMLAAVWVTAWLHSLKPSSS
jgi:uncharacterized membrane protein (DUF4010 family)